MPVGLLTIFIPVPSTTYSHTHYCREAVRSVHIIYSPIKPSCVFEWYNKYSSYTKCYQEFRKVSWCACSKQENPHKYVKRFWITGSILDSTRTCRRYMLSEEQLDDRNLGMIHLQPNHLFSWTTKMGMSAPSVQYEQNCCTCTHIRQQWFTYSTT